MFKQQVFVHTRPRIVLVLRTKDITVIKYCTWSIPAPGLPPFQVGSWSSISAGLLSLLLLPFFPLLLQTRNLGTPAQLLFQLYMVLTALLLSLSIYHHFLRCWHPLATMDGCKPKYEVLWKMKLLHTDYSSLQIVIRWHSVQSVEHIGASYSLPFPVWSCFWA